MRLPQSQPFALGYHAVTPGYVALEHIFGLSLRLAVSPDICIGFILFCMHSRTLRFILICMHSRTLRLAVWPDILYQVYTLLYAFTNRQTSSLACLGMFSLNVENVGNVVKRSEYVHTRE